ncbi:MFS transporter [Luethyella okanaganae]|uniref:MFS transporter n=1 Tax=Luethyella okanaganae TaxID=69372 RepID=A0ABW1VGW1_9MICO
MSVTTSVLAGRRQWVGLAVLTLPTLLASLELTIPNLALPAIAEDLSPSSAQSLWMIDIYGFLLAGSLVTMGTLGDRIGRRRLLLIGATAFGVLSVAAAYAHSAEMLIVTRALLGVAGATLMPTSLALVATMFADSRQRTVAVGVVIASVAGGTAIGPLIGGWVLEHYWWGMVFLIAAPITVVFLIVGRILLPESRRPEAARMDVPSAALSLFAVLAVIAGLKTLAEGGQWWLSAGMTVVGLLMGGVFIRRQRRLDAPLVDLTLFRSSAFSVSLGALLFGVFALFGINFYLAQYLQLVFGLSPLQAGLWTVPAAAGVIVGSTLAPMLIRWARPGRVVSSGLVLAAAGFAGLTQVTPSGGLPVLVVSAVVISLGLGAMMTLATDLVVGSAPPERSGEASALSETAPELGGALGIAVLGSIGTAMFHTRLPPSAATALPAEDAAAVTDTLAGAVAAAETLPELAAVELLTAARQAFTEGLHLVAGINIGLLLLTGTLVSVLLNRSRPTPAIDDKEARTGE